MKIIDIILLACFALIIIIIAVVVLAITAHKKAMNKLHENIFNLLTDLISDQEAKVERTTAYGFQYKIIEKNRITYVCTIYNPKCSEILINSKIKWQIKENPTDDSLVFIDNIVKPMTSEIKDDKEVKKLFIIYPNARQLMIATNECEYAFVYPKTDVYGASVVTYNRLLYTKDIKKM